MVALRVKAPRFQSRGVFAVDSRLVGIVRRFGSMCRLLKPTVSASIGLRPERRSIPIYSCAVQRSRPQQQRCRILRYCGLRLETAEKVAKEAPLVERLPGVRLPQGMTEGALIHLGMARCAHRSGMRRKNSMRWVTNKQEAEYMRLRQAQNRAKYSAAENWMWEKLCKTGERWTRQAMHGYRLFDFWCHRIGVAVEVDGPEHRPDYDAYRDKYAWCRSAIVVLRVPNYDEARAADAIHVIANSQDWLERKAVVKPGKALVIANGMKMARSPTKTALLTAQPKG